MQRVAGADAVEKGHRGVVAGEQQMIAVVDAAAQRLVEIRSATATRCGAGLVQGDTPAALDQFDGGRQTCQPGADDMGVSHSRVNRAAISSLRHFGTFTWVFRSCQPRCSSRSSRAA